MTVAEADSRQLRVLHIVSSNGVPAAAQQALFMPLLTRLPKARVKSQVVTLAPDFAPAAVLRQAGIPVHDVALSTRRFAPSAPQELLKTVREFHPDIIQAWGLTAQLAALLVRTRCHWQPKLVWSPVDTLPLPPKASFLDQQKLKLSAKFAPKVIRIVYTSEAGAAMHRRAGYPDTTPTIMPLGVDPSRCKPDWPAGRKVREQLGLPANAFVVGMLAPFQPEYDHATFLQGVGELIKTHPNVYVLLAGHGVQRGNAPLMALVGGGTMGTRTQLLGDWSDLSSFYNACDVACSTARTDRARMMLVNAMLCGVPCVGTGMGAQGEVLGQFGVAIEPGSPAAIVRGIKRVMDLPSDKRAFMALGARKHALSRFVLPRAAQQYLQLYFELLGIQADAAKELPMPVIDATIPARPVEVVPDLVAEGEKKVASSSIEWQDPDSIEIVAAKKPTASKPVMQEGDVLQIFESNHASGDTAPSRDMERARGLADDIEDLLSPEALQSAEEDALAAAPIKKAADAGGK